MSNTLKITTMSEGEHPQGNDAEAEGWIGCHAARLLKLKVEEGSGS